MSFMSFMLYKRCNKSKCSLLKLPTPEKREGYEFFAIIFLDASLHLHERVCPSICPSLRPSVFTSVRPHVRPSVSMFLKKTYSQTRGCTIGLPCLVLRKVSEELASYLDRGKWEAKAKDLASNAGGPAPATAATTARTATMAAASAATATASSEAAAASPQSRKCQFRRSVALLSERFSVVFSL